MQQQIQNKVFVFLDKCFETVICQYIMRYNNTVTMLCLQSYIHVYVT